VSCTFPLPFDMMSGFRARRHVEVFAAQELLEHETDAMTIIVSELVANAVLHGGRPVALTLRNEHDEVTVEVADGDPRIANVRTRQPDQLGVGGHGLRIVASLADRWGTRPSQFGKTVWATIATAHA
jgi:anti-sigma regulatory factor (Ser/Thr protein kinase)